MKLTEKKFCRSISNCPGERGPEFLQVNLNLVSMLTGVLCVCAKMDVWQQYKVIYLLFIRSMNAEISSNGRLTEDRGHAEENTCRGSSSKKFQSTKISHYHLMEKAKNITSFFFWSPFPQDSKRRNNAKKA